MLTLDIPSPMDAADDDCFAQLRAVAHEVAEEEPDTVAAAHALVCNPLAATHTTDTERLAAWLVLQAAHRQQRRPAPRPGGTGA